MKLPAKWCLGACAIICGFVVLWLAWHSHEDTYLNLSNGVVQSRRVIASSVVSTRDVRVPWHGLATSGGPDTWVLVSRKRRLGASPNYQHGRDIYTLYSLWEAMDIHDVPTAERPRMLRIILEKLSTRASVSVQCDRTSIEIVSEIDEQVKLWPAP